MEAHEYANLFPMLPDAELQELAAGIKNQGYSQEFPIITLEGKILDGRNRWRACQISGVRPITKEYSGTDPLDFVRLANLSRRQLTPSQKAMIAESYAALKDGQRKSAPPHGGAEDKTGSRSDAAEKFGVGTTSIDRARVVKTKGTPELAAAVESGEITVNAASEIAKLPASRQLEVLAEGPEAVKEKAKEIRDFGGEIAPCPKPDFEYIAPPEKEAKKPRNNYRPALGREISIMAITTLQRIGDDDKELEPAYRAVIDHCNERLALNGK